MFHKLDENPSSIYHQLLLSPPLRRANTFPDDHVYEVIPAQKAAREQSRVHQKKHYDDNNYLIPSACNSPYPKGEQVRLRRSRENDTSGQSSTNLRSMKRMGRSMDSISRSANGNKLRSQSTVSRMNFFPWDNTTDASVSVWVGPKLKMTKFYKHGLCRCANRYPLCLINWFPRKVVNKEVRKRSHITHYNPNLMVYVWYFVAL